VQYFFNIEAVNDYPPIRIRIVATNSRFEQKFPIRRSIDKNMDIGELDLKPFHTMYDACVLLEKYTRINKICRCKNSMTSEALHMTKTVQNVHTFSTPYNSLKNMLNKKKYTHYTNTVQ